MENVRRSRMTKEASIISLYGDRPASETSPLSRAPAAALAAIWPDATAKSMPRTW